MTGILVAAAVTASMLLAVSLVVLKARKWNK